MTSSLSRIAVASAVLLTTLACNKSPAVPAAARNTAAVLAGGERGSAASNPLCKLFTEAEVAAYEGIGVNPGKDAAIGMGCQWTDVAGDNSAMVQVVPANYHEPTSEAPGFKKLAGVGSEGFIVPQMGGWHAAAIAGSHSVNVLTGGKSDEAKTVAFLKEAIKRAG